jgi:hypothetical protein
MKRLWFVAALFLLPAAALGATDEATLWPKLPFRPAMLQKAGTPVCDAIYRDLLTAFFGKSMWPNPLGTREVAFTPLHLHDEGSSYGVATFDPYNQGKPFLVLQAMEEGGAERFGVAYYRRLVQSELDQMTAQQGDLSISPTSLGQPVIDSGQMVDYADNPTPQPVPEFVRNAMVVTPAMPRFFRFDGHVYLYSPGVYYDENGGVYDLSSATEMDQICLFKSDPGYDVDIKKYEAYSKAADVPTLDTLASPLLPHGHVCETSGDDSYTRSFRAFFRPWALEDPAAHDRVGSGNFDRYMRNRGLAGLERHRQWLTYRGARDKAIAAMVRYFADAFGRDDAETRRLAAVWIDEELFDAARFDLDEPTIPLLDADFAATQRAAEAAFAGDVTALKAVLGAKPWERGRFDESLYSDALEHLDAMQALLEMKFDPNVFGASGRTALMIAARLDLKDAAILLLDHGAKPNLGAGEAVAKPYSEGDVLCMKEGSPPPGDVPGRTALSYAAERASPATVQALLAHGADPASADKDGHTPEYWAAKRTDPAAGEIAGLLRSKK